MYDKQLSWLYDMNIGRMCSTTSNKYWITAILLLISL